MRYLVLSPHTDDGELGCGGTINKLLEQDNEVIYVAFSCAELSIPKGFKKGTTRQENLKALKILGIKNPIILNFPTRNFSKYRQNILEEIIKINKKFSPDVVFLPSSYDTHQDHQVIFNEGFRAFKKICMLGYELPWNNLTFKTQAFSLLEERHVIEKAKALAEYKSQAMKYYMTEDFIESLAKARGVQIGSHYAEAFEAVRWII